MSLLVDKAKKVGLSLEKKGLYKPPVMRVVAALDISGSTTAIYDNGSMQQAFDQLLGVGLKFDDNGEIDTYLFNNACVSLGTTSADDEGTFVKNKVRHRVGGGTDYAPVFDGVEADMFAPKQTFLGSLFGRVSRTPANNMPVCAFLITDGANQDEREAEVAIARSSQYNIFWTLVGVGDPSEFKFISRMAGKYPNIGFINFGNIRMSDEDMYDALFTQKFVEWAKRFPSA